MLSRTITVITLLVLTASRLCAQDLSKAIHVDMDIVDTPASKGFVPFYISHYGRHGSRCHTPHAYSSNYSRCLMSMHSFDEGLRNRKNNILVKPLYNERETLIPSLKAFHGPYYRWEDLRMYLLSCCD